MKETERLEKDPVPGITAVPVDGNVREFKVTLEGPAETPYHAGIFSLELYLPDGYPMVPPKVRFLTKVRRAGGGGRGERGWVLGAAPAPRPASGAGCLCGGRRGPFMLRAAFARTARVKHPPRPPSTPAPPQIYHPNIDKLGRICLDILKDKWSPALQIRHVLLSIMALMSTPAPDDPLANDVATVWKADQAKALATAREWTRMYAKAA